MPLSADVSTLVEELIRADLAWLASEIIEAIELPQPVNVTRGDVADQPQISGYQPGLETRWDLFPQSGRREIRPDVERTPILTDAEQLTLTTEIVRLRLVEPVRRLAEAERIAGQIAVAGVVRGQERLETPRRRSKPVAFALDGRDGTALIGTEDLEVVEELAGLLREIAGFAPRPRPSESEA